MNPLFEIKCNVCGETTFTNVESRVGSKHGLKIDNKGECVLCDGIWERVPEDETDEVSRTVIAGLVG